MSEIKPNQNNENKIDKNHIFQALTNRIIHEHQVYLTRTNIMLALNTGALTIAIISNSTPSNKFVLFLLGSVISIIWFIINFFSLKWINFWENQLKKFGLSHYHGDFIFPFLNNNAPKYPTLIEKLLLFLALLFLGLWSLWFIA